MLRRAAASSSQNAVGSPLGSPWRTRPLPFLLVGGLAAMTKLALLAVLMRLGWSVVIANAVALLTSTQVNFALNASFTWRDRWAAADRATARSERTHLVASRWLRFMGATAGSSPSGGPLCSPCSSSAPCS